jgi:hypothetical protein
MKRRSLRFWLFLLLLLLSLALVLYASLPFQVQRQVLTMPTLLVPVP